MKNIIIYTTYPCLIKLNGQDCHLDESEHLVIDEPLKKLYVYPTGKSKSFAFTIEFPLISCKHYNWIEKEDKILIFLLDGLEVENVDCYHFSYKGQTCDIEVATNSLVFSTPLHKKRITLNSAPNEVSCGQFKHINYVLTINNDNEKIICYNPITNKTKLFSGNKIKLNSSGFSVIKEQYENYDKITEEYIVDEDGLKVKNKTFIQSDRLIPENLLVYQFMSSIKNGDISSAYSILSRDLQNEIDKDVLKQYFGDVSYFYLLDVSTCFAIVEGKNKLFEFNVTDGKINEINDFN